MLQAGLQKLVHGQRDLTATWKQTVQCNKLYLELERSNNYSISSSQLLNPTKDLAFSISYNVPTILFRNLQKRFWKEPDTLTFIVDSQAFRIITSIERAPHYMQI